MRLDPTPEAGRREPSPESSAFTDGGDSGGPWFWNNTAYGVHKGYKWIWFYNRSTFSQAHLSPNALGVSVVTN